MEFCHIVGKTFIVLLLTRTNTTFHTFIGMLLFVLWKCDFSAAYFAAIAFFSSVSFKYVSSQLLSGTKGSRAFKLK